jgi:hypothetical protein
MTPNCPLTQDQRRVWCKEWNCKSWKHCPVRPIALSHAKLEKSQLKFQLNLWAMIDNMRAHTMKELRKWRERYCGKDTQK